MDKLMALHHRAVHAARHHAQKPIRYRENKWSKAEAAFEEAFTDRLARESIEGREPEQFGYATPEEHAIADMQYPADVEPPGER